ncbi:MAG: DUF6809 family protein [Oscillospiraceae bacterium]
MKNILSSLYGGALPNEEQILEDQEHKEAEEKVCLLEKALRERLCEADQALFDDLIEAQLGAVGQSEQQRFVQGFRMGAQAMLEILAED